MHHKNFVDPYEGYRGGIDRLQQKPLPKHNDMDAGVLASMKLNGLVPPPVNNARGALERLDTRTATQTGLGARGPPGSHPPVWRPEQTSVEFSSAVASAPLGSAAACPSGQKGGCGGATQETR